MKISKYNIKYTKYLIFFLGTLFGSFLLKNVVALNVGSKAPLFKLKDQNGNIFNSQDFIGKKNIVVYFYPKDETMGCSIEAKKFANFKEQFDKLNTIVVGISADNQASHLAFAQKENLNFQILSDENFHVIKKYNSYSKGMISDIERNTFLIDKNGNIVKIWKNVINVIWHAEDVYKEIIAIEKK